MQAEDRIGWDRSVRSDRDVNRCADRCATKAASVRKSGGHHIDILRGNIFGSKCRGSKMSIEVRVSTSVSP